MPTELEQQNKILKVLCSYLLLERKQETPLAMAFGMLVQERHNQFHTLGDRIEGDESEFSDCNNKLCTEAFNVIKGSREMAVEVNDLTIQMIANFQLKIRNEGRVCRAWLDPLPEVKSPKLVVPGQEK